MLLRPFAVSSSWSLHCFCFLFFLNSVLMAHSWVGVLATVQIELIREDGSEGERHFLHLLRRFGFFFDVFQNLCQKDGASNASIMVPSPVLLDRERTNPVYPWVHGNCKCCKIWGCKEIIIFCEKHSSWFSRIQSDDLKCPGFVWWTDQNLNTLRQTLKKGATCISDHRDSCRRQIQEMSV